MCNSTNKLIKGDIMSTQSTNPVQPTSSSLNPFNIIGGLFSDTIELTKMVASEIADVPSALYDGFNNGAILNTENSEAIKAQQTTVTPSTTKPEPEADQPTNAQIDEEIKRLTALRTLPYNEANAS